MLDNKAAQAWVGHPYFDVVDNSSDFEAKVCRMIQVIIERLGLCRGGGGDTVDQDLRKMFGDEVVDMVLNEETRHLSTTNSVSRSSSSSNADTSSTRSSCYSSSSGYGCSDSFDDDSQLKNGLSSNDCLSSQLSLSSSELSTLSLLDDDADLEIDNRLNAFEFENVLHQDSENTSEEEVMVVGDV